MITQTAINLAAEVYDRGTDVGDLRYLISQERGDTHVAIRGTANAENWWHRNLMLWPRKSPLGHWMHAGVVGAFEALAAQPAIREVMRLPGEQVVYCGHSLGGGICMPFLEAHLGSRAVTIGGMRVYWRWGQGPATRHTRIAAAGDPVPRRLWPLYRHVHTGIVLPDNDGWPEIADHAAQAYQDAWARHMEVNRCVAYS